MTTTDYREMENEIKAVTKDDIRKQVEFAASVVMQWPAWKRNILVHSAQPTNSQSRAPVSNGKCL